MHAPRDDLTRMPACFVGHGSPGTLVDAEKTALWSAWGEALPRPDALVVFSAHWEEGPVSTGRTRSHDELLYDFQGFPGWMYRLRYPAPGAPGLADHVRQVLSEGWAVETSDRPLDHGVWMPLLHMFPEADVPVLQVSMPWDLDDRELLMIGQALAPLRDEGVLLLGSGNLVHDTRLPSSERPQLPEHAVRFDAWVTDVLARGDVASLLDWMSLAPDPAACHPTPEHFRPLLIVAGAGSGDSVSFPVDGFEHGTISRRCVQFG